jgi:hypothetical protein
MEPSEVTEALAATRSVASEVGLDVDDAIVLQNANRLAVHLVPCDVLARVRGTVGQDPHATAQAAAFELEMARRLANTDSPIGVLEPRVEPLVYERDGFTLTYWQYYEPMADDRVTPVEYAEALERLHARDARGRRAGTAVHRPRRGSTSRRQ